MATDVTIKVNQQGSLVSFSLVNSEGIKLASKGFKNGDGLPATSETGVREIAAIDYLIDKAKELDLHVL